MCCVCQIKYTAAERERASNAGPFKFTLTTGSDYSESATAAAQITTPKAILFQKSATL